MNGPSHAREGIPSRFIVEDVTAWDPRYVGRLIETIAERSPLPVLLFDGRALRELNRHGAGP